jgi:redox-regulated HSP33 family molecular chaperone
MRVAVVVVSCVSFLGAVGAFVVLTALGKDTTAYVGFVSITCGTLVAQIANLFKTNSIQQQATQLQSDVTEVKKATNGPLAAALTQISEVHEAVQNGKGTP